MTSSKLTAERVRAAFDYDGATGVFRWRTTHTNSKKKPGDYAGSIDRLGYVRITIDGERHLAHRLAWLHVHGEWPSMMIDHVDGNKSNNRLDNLRDVSRSVNGQNQKRAQRNNRTRTLGVTRRSGNHSKPFQAYITTAGRAKYLGVFASEAEAGAAYLDAKRRAHEGCTL